GQPEKTGTSEESKRDETRGVEKHQQSVETEHRGADGTVQSTLFRDNAEPEGYKHLILWEKETIHVKYAPQQSAAQAENRSEQTAHKEEKETTIKPEPSEETHQAADQHPGQGETSTETGSREKPPEITKRDKGAEAGSETPEVESANTQKEAREGERKSPSDAERGEEKTTEKERSEKEGREKEAKDDDTRKSRTTGERRKTEKERGKSGKSSERRLVAGVEVPRAVLSADVDDVMRRAVLKAGGREALINKLKRLRLRFDENQIRRYEYSKSRKMDGHTFLALLKFLEGPGRVGEVLQRLNERVRAAKRLVKSDWSNAEEFLYIFDANGKHYIFSLAEVLKLFSEGIKKAGSLEKLAEELRKRGRGAIVYGYLINEWLRSRQIPLEVFIDAVRYVEETEEKVRERISTIAEKTGSKLLSHNFQKLVAHDPHSLAADPLTTQKLEERAKRLYESDAELRHLIKFEDLVYAMNIVVGGLLRGLPHPTNKEEAQKTQKKIEEAIKYFEKLLEKAKNNLLSHRIQKLTNNETQYIRNAAQTKTRQQLNLSPDTKLPETGERGYLTHLAKEIGIHTPTLQSYLDPNHDKRQKPTREVYLKICNALNLPETMRETKMATREEITLTLLQVTQEQENKKTTKPEAENETEEELLHLPWYEQNPRTRCVFHKKDLQMLKKAALKLCDGNEKELVKVLKEMGLERVPDNEIKITWKTMDVEIVLALIGLVIDRNPWEVIELIQSGELAEEFRNAMHAKNLVDDENHEWVEYLSESVVREVSLKTLAEQQGRKIETPEEALKLLQELTEQGVLDRKFSINLPSLELSKLGEKIDQTRKKEAGEKNLYQYTADKLNEHLQEDEKINKQQAGRILRGNTIKLKHYLILCKAFNLEPNPNLHHRTIIKTRYPRRKTSDIDFPTPVQYVDPHGKTITIQEQGRGDFYVIVDGRRLRAEKWKMKYGGKWWGLTVIDYVTEEGVYTVVKETGQLWPPHLRPWYAYPANKVSVRFKTPQPLQKLIQTLQKQTNQSINAISKAIGISSNFLHNLLSDKEAKKSISLANLLVLLSFKSTLAQTDPNEEIKQIEKHVLSIGKTTIHEDRKQDILYINLKTSAGAALIGHELGDGNLRHRGAATRFGYDNTRRENTEEVNTLLKHYGIHTTIKTRKRKKGKKQYYVLAEGLITHALWCATPQAAGNKTKNNPKVPEWITNNTRRSPHPPKRQKTNSSFKR
ncbi:MAG: LAGLIDADG family homing endonuclease, partial [Candidatus Freyarchaeota archaeon]